jgi:hypothetical protein
MLAIIQFKIFCLPVSYIHTYIHTYIHKTKFVILPIVLYGCETCSLTLRNTDWGLLRTVLRRKFGPKSDEHGAWRKLHNDELHSVYSSPNIVRVIKSRMRGTGHIGCMGEGRGVYRILVGRPEGKRPLGRPRRRWGDKIKLDLGR